MRAWRDGPNGCKCGPGVPCKFCNPAGDENEPPDISGLFDTIDLDKDRFGTS
jgi:hypothetical protein